MKHLTLLLMFGLLVLSQSCTQKTPHVNIEGETKLYHKITLLVDGPHLSEWSKENPFLDYELQATFTKGAKKLVVPGYFAADGHAGETSADEGAYWKIHFRPDEVGEWNYKLSFKKGKNITVIDDKSQAASISLDGYAGTISVEESDKTGDDFRANGSIINGGKGYFVHQANRKIWMKSGADSPENFLAFVDFDQTHRFTLKKVVREGEADPKKGIHKYEKHVKSWNEGDPTWQNGKGKAIIGAVNYLKASGVNSIYMLTMNIIGDGKDVWPYNDYNERYRFDCSKLDQWEVVFEHMEKLGVMAHFVLQETENECLLDMGHTGVQRKVYLREMVARFGHHLALTWNLGEENGPIKWSPIGQTDKQKKAMASYLKKINPYPCNVVLHTHANNHHQDLYLDPMLGFENLDGPSMQIANPKNVHARVKAFVEKSKKSGKQWVVALDEIGPHWKGVLPDAVDAKHDTIRNDALWGSLMAGGAGVEWYFGYRFADTDLTCEDFGTRDNWWKQSAIATQFMSNYPLESMANHDELVEKGAYCFAKPGDLYLVYFPKGTKKSVLQLKNKENRAIAWFDPVRGGNIQFGSIKEVKGTKEKVSLGNPPSDSDQDWVAVVQ